MLAALGGREPQSPSEAKALPRPGVNRRYPVIRNTVTRRSLGMALARPPLDSWRLAVKCSRNIRLMPVIALSPFVVPQPAGIGSLTIPVPNLLPSPVSRSARRQC